MKTERRYPKIYITKKGERWLSTGHPWVYATDISAKTNGEGQRKDADRQKYTGRSDVTVQSTDGSGLVDAENGCIVDVLTEGGKYMGSGFLSRESLIRVRLLSRNANDTFDEAFWRRRIGYAIDYRLTVMGDDLDAFRVIFGEADGFPGLTVDKFHDLLSVQVLSVGIERIRDSLFPMLVSELEKRGFSIRGLYIRNDAAIREKEGLKQYKAWYDLPGKSTPGSPVTEIVENGIIYEVDVENGQKTGFFLDQKYNRLAAAKIARGKRVLDCFTHTGSFALNAAKGGALHVTAVDISESAIDMAKKNAARNGLSDRMDFVTADVFDLLPSLIEKGGHPYDMIILDPPAFTKSRKTADNAKKGYKEINYRALRLLPRGGYLVTASCSHFMPHAEFEKMMASAAKDADVSLKQIEMRTQAPDHPILWNVPETDYLKLYLFQVV